jgi:hypothetical protein
MVLYLSKLGIGEDQLAQSSQVVSGLFGIFRQFLLSDRMLDILEILRRLSKCDQFFFVLPSKCMRNVRTNSIDRVL